MLRILPRAAGQSDLVSWFDGFLGPPRLRHLRGRKDLGMPLFRIAIVGPYRDRDDRMGIAPLVVRYDALQRDASALVHRTRRVVC